LDEQPSGAEQEKYHLRRFLGLLLEADEPEAMLGSLQRIAERKAQGLILNGNAERWYRLAVALAGAQALLDLWRPAVGATTNAAGEIRPRLVSRRHAPPPVEAVER
jgi:hypothetical protein